MNTGTVFLGKLIYSLSEEPRAFKRMIQIKTAQIIKIFGVFYSHPENREVVLYYFAFQRGRLGRP